MINTIFITGGSGCIGHYVIEECLSRFPNTELHLLIRPQSKLREDLKKHPRVVLHLGSMENIEQLKDILSNMDALIHIATPWGSGENTIKINVNQSLCLFNTLSTEKIQRIIYFSSASILEKDNKLSLAAKEKGTAYIRSKYLLYEKIQTHPLKDKICTVFPTLVFGGDKRHPYSHITSGLKEAKRYLKILRWFNLKLKFHFCHGKDIASVCCSLLQTKDHEIVIGSSVLTAKESIQVLCKHFKIPVWQQISIPNGLIFLLLSILRIKLHPWDRHCIKHPVFEYKTHSPKNFGECYHYPKFEDVLKTVSQNS